MSKSAIYVANTANVATAEGEVVQLGSTVRRYGCSVAQNGNAITLECGGYYSVAVSVTAAPTAAGNVSVTLQKDGVAVPGAYAASTTAAAAQSANLAFSCVVRTPQCKCLDASSITLVLGGSDSIVDNVAVEVVKL